MLDDLKKDYPDILIEEIDAASADGQGLIIKHGIMQGPGILVNDEFFAMGNVTEKELKGKFEELKSNN